ncbi:hypothetical protein EVAR_65935_1 [Eumeta japonica]|uniref:Uncharacterized protein n=1 Tax=Eumeta variegata TaxID=151549 RepID=A0A4C2AAN4_EUMVA|nr:hypothetical protein EVAR_65935_1 [Eumeta japonica]
MSAQPAVIRLHLRVPFYNFKGSIVMHPLKLLRFQARVDFAFESGKSHLKISVSTRTNSITIVGQKLATREEVMTPLDPPLIPGAYAHYSNSLLHIVLSSSRSVKVTSDHFPWINLCA